MKKIQLAACGLALVTAATAAQAQMSFSGEALVGYSNRDGLFYLGSLTGESGNVSLTLGPTSAATEIVSSFDGMNYSFYDVYDAPRGQLVAPFIVRGDVSFGQTQFAVSYETSLLEAGNNGLAVAVRTMVGGVTLSAGYQSEGYFIGCCGIEGTGEVYGASAAFALGDIEATIAYIHGDHSPFMEIYDAVGAHIAMSRGAASYEAYVSLYNSEISILSPRPLDSISFGASYTYDFGNAAMRTYYNSDQLSIGQNFGVDLSYSASDVIMLYGGYRFYDGAYASVVYSGIAEGVELGLSYSDSSSIPTLDGNHLLEGIAVWLSAEF